MAPCDSPPAVLAERLAGARRAGASFAEAWPVARAAALEGVPSQDQRKSWSMALFSTARDWQEAYDRFPSSRLDDAVVVLSDPDRETLSLHTIEEDFGASSWPCD